MTAEEKADKKALEKRVNELEVKIINILLKKENVFHQYVFDFWQKKKYLLRRYLFGTKKKVDEHIIKMIKNASD